ncbi:DUF6286 domain-containing protein [Actinosynnema sp. NPDC020468]|uniref:DUF6286 domain-containing protein n=1 Tax=Actinosynnema sp. NPDC020468 TaxID=3154488 RepID=UPI0033C0C977
MRLHPRRSLPAVLTALVCLGGCVLVAVVAVQLLLGERPWVDYAAVAGTLRDLRWTDPQPAVAGAAAALLGLVLLLTATIPGRPTVLPLAGPLPAGARRAGFTTSLRHAAQAADGVASARITLRRKKIVVTATTNRTAVEGLADAVREAVDHRLDALEPSPRPRVVVRVRAPRSTS